MIQSFRTSKKHLIGLPISFVMSLLFLKFDIMKFNDLIYNDEIFGIEFQTPLILGQSILVLFVGFCTNWCFEYYQQRKLVEKPSRIDTLMDCIYFALSSWVGYLITLLFI